ncbi:MAG: hypothetical protein CFR70_06205 [Rhodocyclaceae bacterium]|nr:MAG: hypothetical protein CFR70_06205 [Rhodocyclaceae bacterium]
MTMIDRQRAGASLIREIPTIQGMVVCSLDFLTAPVLLCSPAAVVGLIATATQGQMQRVEVTRVR